MIHEEPISWWNEEKLEYFISRWAIPRECHSYECCIYPIRSCFRLLVTTVRLLLSWTCLPIRSSVALFSFCLFLRTTVMLPVPTALVHPCHISSQFPLQNEPLSQCPSRWSSALLHYSSLYLSIQLAVFPVPSSADKFRAASFSLPWAIVLGRRALGPGIRRMPESFYRLEFLVFCGQYESWTLELVRSHSNPPFDFFSQKDISCPMCVHSGIDSRASPFSLISISALFIITLVVLYVVLVELLCSVLLVHSQFLVVYR